MKWFRKAWGWLRGKPTHKQKADRLAQHMLKNLRAAAEKARLAEDVAYFLGPFAHPHRLDHALEGQKSVGDVERAVAAYRASVDPPAENIPNHRSLLEGIR